MTVAAPRRLSPVPAAPDDDAAPVTVPVSRDPHAAGATPWRTQDEVAFVPAALLLAAAGRCSCDDCCAVLVERLRAEQLTRV